MSDYARPGLGPGLGPHPNLHITQGSHLPVTCFPLSTVEPPPIPFYSGEGSPAWWLHKVLPGGQVTSP